MSQPPPDPTKTWTIADILGTDNTASHFEDMAKQNKGVYDAHINEGFSPDDAIAIVLHMVGTILQSRMMLDSMKDDEDGTD